MQRVAPAISGAQAVVTLPSRSWSMLGSFLVGCTQGTRVVGDLSSREAEQLLPDGCAILAERDAQFLPTKETKEKTLKESPPYPPRPARGGVSQTTANRVEF